ncbi:MFS transporter [Paraburkholderia caribensis]|uniref:MFS transporter n=1 Tax=Paraburkholderia caribensis TaxID=75105 RepID=UPI0018D40267|nr:MFS transporter [Paraburkholderia caribensis]
MATGQTAAGDAKHRYVSKPKDGYLTPLNVCGLVTANALEFFDFFIYAMFAVYIGRAFFPADWHLDGTASSLATFAVGYLSRPIGAVVLGRYSDRCGRKRAALVTGSLITLGSIGIAVVPDYESIGIWASVIVLTCRVLQGFAIGGEFGAVSALLIEQGPRSRAATQGGFQMAGQGLAQLLAGIAGVSLITYLPAEVLERWGWRIPFALAAMLLPIQLYLRRSLRESVAQPDCDMGARGVEAHDWLPQTFCTIGMIFGGTVPTYVVIYVAAFGVSGGPTSPSASFATASAIGIATLLASLIGGALGDRIGIGRIVVVSRVATALSVYPIFNLLSLHNPAPVSAGMISVVAALSALGGGPTIAFVTLKFPARHRATGLAIAYATGVALFGGTAPMIAAAITKSAGSGIATAWYVMLAALVALVSQALLDRFPDRDLQV